MIALVAVYMLLAALCCDHQVSTADTVPSYENIGCFKDKPKKIRSLPEHLGSFRGHIDWQKEWPSFESVVRNCSLLAQEKGYLYFGIQHYGECWSGPDAHKTFYKYGMSTRCLATVGKGCANRVYMIIGAGREQCASKNYHILDDKNRSDKSKGYTNKCDNPLPHGKGWYRFKGQAGNAMATVARGKYSCNTINPGWMTGERPEFHSPAVNRKVCFVSDEPWETNYCKYSVDIQVKNCGHFLVYNLPQTPRCVLRYCGSVNSDFPYQL